MLIVPFIGALVPGYFLFFCIFPLIRMLLARIFASKMGISVILTNKCASVPTFLHLRNISTPRLAQAKPRYSRGSIS